MSDPFVPGERTWGVAYRLLEVLAEFDYPAVVSTKSDLFADEKYLEVLKRGTFALQVSVSSLDGALLSDIDCGTPGPDRLIMAATEAARAGLPVSCRMQPLLPTRESDAFDVIDACASAGITHVGVEHLKLPVEREWKGTRLMSDALGIDLTTYFREAGAVRVGREWVLPLGMRLDRILELGAHIRSRGMTFGAADTDLLPVGDGSCCCSGLDLEPRFQATHFRHNYAEAVRRSANSSIVTYSSIENEWIPSRSISRWMNSRVRIDPSAAAGSMGDYLKNNWYGSPNGASPRMFYGVEESGERDSAGLPVYEVTDELRGLIAQSRRG